MGKENTISKWIKLDVDEFELKQEFLQLFQWPSTLPSNNGKKKIAVCKRRMANKHKEHKHHKLVGY